MRLNTKSEGLGKSALKTHVSLMTQKAKRRRWKENAYGLTNKESNFPGQKGGVENKALTMTFCRPIHPSIHPHNMAKEMLLLAKSQCECE